MLCINLGCSCSCSFKNVTSSLIFLYFFNFSSSINRLIVSFHVEINFWIITYFFSTTNFLSAGRDSKTLMILNVCPNIANLSETLSSLSFCSRARNATLSLGNRDTIKKWRDVVSSCFLMMILYCLAIFPLWMCSFSSMGPSYLPGKWCRTCLSFCPAHILWWARIQKLGISVRLKKKTDSQSVNWIAGAWKRLMHHNTIRKGSRNCT